MIVWEGLRRDESSCSSQRHPPHKVSFHQSISPVLDLSFGRKCMAIYIYPS